MPSAANLSPEKRFMGMFVGPKHSGKTSAACTFLKKGSQTRLKVLDGDGRINGILGCPWVEKDRIDYDYYPPRVAGNTKPFFQRVNDDLEGLLTLIQTGKSPYETYVGDSATAFCKNLILDALPLTHVNDQGGIKGRRLGTMNLAGIEEYKFESTGMDAYLSFLRSMPLNVILTAHVVPKWGYADGKAPGPGEIKERTEVGEELSLRAKIAANTSIYFDHIFRFDRKMVGGQERFYVEFIGDLACTSYPNLTPGHHDITGQNFYEYLMQKVRGQEK